MRHDRAYFERKIRFLEHRANVLRQRIDKGGSTQAQNDAVVEFREMLEDYKDLLRKAPA